MHMKATLPDTQKLKRFVWLALVLFFVLLLAFAGFYYFDRYVHIGDRSPLEVGIRQLEAQVRADPTAHEPRLALAEYYLRNQRYADALSQADQVLGVEPDNERALFVSGLASIFSGETASGVQALEMFASSRRNTPVAPHDLALEAALYYLGDGYLQLAQPDRAVPVLQEALVISPTDADALYKLGLAHYQLGAYADALSSLAQAVKFVPDFAEAYQVMAECYRELNLSGRELYALGMVAYANKDYEKALADLQQARQVLPEDADVYLGLGLTCERLGDLAGAEQALATALNLEPDRYMVVHALERVRQAIAR